MRRDDFDAQLASVAALGDPIRRLLYRFVIAQGEPVSRDQAAAGVDVARHIAKFHLDRLESDGLLASEFRRPEGRGGPGAGRPAKLYRRSTRQIDVSLPERRYDLAGRVMAQAITAAEHSGTPVTDALRQAASAAGRELGTYARHAAGARASQAALVEAVTEVLAEQGYEPRSDPDGITMANCPFHSLAQDYTALVCGMNLDLMTGMLAALPPIRLQANLDPAPARCCVTLTRPAGRGTVRSTDSPEPGDHERSPGPGPRRSFVITEQAAPRRAPAGHGSAGRAARAPRRRDSGPPPG